MDDASRKAARSRGLIRGHEAQQGYNYLSNPWETPFTRIISVTSVLRNGLYYAGKERLGLPAMLTGTGMCFSRRLLERHAWTSYPATIGLAASPVRVAAEQLLVLFHPVQETAIPNYHTALRQYLFGDG